MHYEAIPPPPPPPPHGKIIWSEIHNFHLNYAGFKHTENKVICMAKCGMKFRFHSQTSKSNRWSLATL